MISAYKTAETDPIPCKRVCLKLEFRHSRKYSHIEGAQHKVFLSIIVPDKWQQVVLWKNSCIY